MSENVKASELPLPPAGRIIHSFHWQDNWYFSRGSDGQVIIEHWDTFSDKDAGEPPKFRLEIPGTAWSSIVASVSSEGETSFTWRLVRALHGDWTK